MNIRPCRLLSCFILAGVFSSGAVFPAEDSAATRAQLEQIQKLISSLQSWQKKAAGERTGLQQSLSETETRISELGSRIRDLNQSISSNQQQLNQLEVQENELQQATRAQQSQIADHIRSSYQLGNQAYLKLLLNQQSPDKLARAMRYYDYFNQARTGQIDQFRATLDQLITTRDEISARQSRLQADKADLSNEQQQLADSREERRQVLAKLDQDISSKNQEINKLQADKAQLEELLKELQRQQLTIELPDASSPISQLKGKLPAPVKGKITQRYGSKDSSGTSYNGILISANTGDAVQAIHHGQVLFADWLRHFGLLIIIDHGEGYLSLYGHNDSLYKTTGDWVNPGDTIAAVGNSGGQQQSGLYFEMRKDGNPINPGSWIRNPAQ